ncbi:hypothetical protein AB8Q97_26940, partial [Klebsiella pneumoniae subsp. ozaenae]
MVPAIRCHRQNMKTSIINGSEVSSLPVAIQLNLFTAEFISEYCNSDGSINWALFVARNSGSKSDYHSN